MTKQQRYAQTNKGRVTRRKYNQSVKFKAAQKRYRKSRKGIAAVARALMRYLATPNGQIHRRETRQRWIRRHPEQSRVSHANKEARRRSRQKQNAQGNITVLNKIYARAAELREWFDVVVDHIIPLSKGGAHSPENLQIIYRSENSKKGAHLDYKPSIVFVFV